MDNKQSRFWYIFFIFVGFVITVATVQYFTRATVGVTGAKNIENFETVAATTTTGTPTTLQQIEPDQVVADMPRKTKLALYLTAFSEPPTYQCDTNYWCDAIDPKTKFFLLSDATLPATLAPATGLPMNGVLLRGPSAYSLSPVAPHILGSFTLAFYAKINDLSVLDNNETIVLFDLPAESPYRVQVFIRPTYNTDGTVDNTKAGISCTFGNECSLESNTNVWEYDRNTLMSTVNTPTLFALVFDKENKTMQFFAGISTTPQDPRAFLNGVVPEIKLGISEMTINKTKNWNANLVAVAFYNASLSLEDLRTVDKYLMQHSTGYSTMVRANETLESQVQALMQKLNTGEDTIRELLDKLNAAGQCSPTDSTSDLANKLKRWHISMEGNANITGTDLGKCSILNINSFGAKAADIAATAVVTGTTSSTTTTNRKYNIPYPSDVSTSTPTSSAGMNSTLTNPTKPASTTSSNTSNTSTSSGTPVAPTAPASPSSPVDQDDPNGFWKSFFDFLKNQKEKTDETKENTDLNKAYDELRAEVAKTDKTEPGPGANLLKASVQDPPKKEETTAVTETKSGFWQTIKSIFSDL